MLKVKCIKKIRDENNHIIGYTIIGNDKKPIPVNPDELKESIRSGQLEVTNLTLTSDNRLIDKKSVTSSKQISTIGDLLNRVKTLGYIINTFNTDCGHKCYVASSPDNRKHRFIIPDDVKYIYESGSIWRSIEKEKLCAYLSNIEGALKVVGGKGLTSAFSVFHSCSAQSIDLSSFNTSKVTNMDSMFCDCKAQSLNLSPLDTSNVTDMSMMFYDCEAQSIDLTSFDTSKVTNMFGMFEGCKAQSLDLTSFDTGNVTAMWDMFHGCRAQSLDLRSFDTSKVTNMRDMFYDCEAQYIDLRSFNTSNVTDMNDMFSGCKAQYIDLSSFDTSNVTDMCCMFSYCKAQIRIKDPKLEAQLQEDGQEGKLWGIKQTT